MNQAERLLRRVFHFGDGHTGGDVFFADHESRADPFDFIHPDAHHSLFGPSGTKELFYDRDSFVAFAKRCGQALSARHDEILAITSIDEQCALVHARATRTSAATGEQICYEWAMLYRVEDGLVTYSADMLDADAQAFWGRVLGD